MLELLVDAFGQIVALHHQLYAAGAVLQFDEGDLAHHALGQHATGQSKHFIHLRQGLGIILRKAPVQFSRIAVGPEIVRIGDGIRLQRMQFFAPLGDQAVFFLRAVGARVLLVLFAHAYLPVTA